MNGVEDYNNSTLGAGFEGIRPFSVAFENTGVTAADADGVNAAAWVLLVV